MEFFAVIIALLIVLASICAIKTFSNRCKSKLPPGPKPLPIIGSIHLLGKNPNQSLARLASIHGPVMYMRLGFSDTVVLSSAAAAKDVMQKQDLRFCNRPITDAVVAHDHFKYSVGWLPVAPQWKCLRKLLNSNFFSGNRIDAIQHLRVKNVQELITYCQKCCDTGVPVNVGRAAFRTTLNLLSNTIFSKNLTDPFSDSAKEFKELVVKITEEIGKPNIVDFFPFLEKIDPQRVRSHLNDYFGRVMDGFKILIDERLEQKSSSDHLAMKDVIDELLKMNRESPHELEMVNILHLCLDLFVAGTDTISSTMEWAMAETIKSPTTMSKAKSELEKVIGKGKILKESDIGKLPYLRCIVKETLRLHPPAPLIHRTVEKDREVFNYVVPKDSHVIINVWAIGRDSNSWPDPEEFKPERFLGSEIDIPNHDFELIPFGGGRRSCPGQPLATRMVPVMLGSLINCFDWKIDEELDMEEKFGFTLQKAQALCTIPICCTSSANEYHN